ncbi:hypothetical protein [Listeria rustica]|uniref:Uncharacterized protein n=1 Tax=Listeria rustica TaxID=2713503 RepID=A0A7W1T8I7_9LIST|nr:hypothetical protein [Listeria rustica]MBA3927414.1 hypothetical protein [Listeria rustica]
MSKRMLNDVFGVADKVLESYVDRDNLDDRFEYLLTERSHICIHGSSKSGKSWLRRRVIKESLIVQCRRGWDYQDIYTAILSELDIELIIKRTKTAQFSGTIKANGSAGVKLIAKVEGGVEAGYTNTENVENKIIGKDFTDIKYIAELIIASDRRVVLEDFHYLAPSERKNFAFDLKSFWDYGCFFVVIGVWSQRDLLVSLNHDLLHRVNSLSINWSEEDLCKVIQKGEQLLNVEVGDELKKIIVKDSFGNVALLQTLIKNILLEYEIYGKQKSKVVIDDFGVYLRIAQRQAEDLEIVYQNFAKNVSEGIRKRKNSTDSYKLAIENILSMGDQILIEGYPKDDLFKILNEKNPKIIRPNFDSMLNKLEEIQADDDGRNIILSYDESRKLIILNDKQLLFYRKHKTKNWPWEDLDKYDEDI